MAGGRHLYRYQDYAGVIHVHSNASDGLKKADDIVGAAGAAGCDYIILTDHNTLKGLNREGWYGRTLLLTGEEISVGKNLGHYLGMRLSNPVPPGESPQESVDSVARQGGIGFIAHPFSKQERNLFSLTTVAWQDWSVEGFTGLEIWNYSQDWKENFGGWWTFPPGLLCPESFIDGPPALALEKWDELLESRKVVGIGSVDAHGFFYSYEKMFRTLRTHALLENPLSNTAAGFTEDKKAVYLALERGNCFLSFDALADARGFMFSADNGGWKAIMGGDITLTTGVSLRIISPVEALLQIIRNGRVIASAENAKSLMKIIYEPGAYRAEAYLKRSKGLKKVWRPWVFSNPIRCLPSGAGC